MFKIKIQLHNIIFYLYLALLLSLFINSASATTFDAIQASTSSMNYALPSFYFVYSQRNMTTFNSFQKKSNHKTDALCNFLKETRVNGTLRSYYFIRNFSRDINQPAFSAGGELNVLSGVFLKALRAGLSVYTAQPFGLNSHNPLKVDQTLPGRSVTVLTQSYLQYHYQKLLLRGGYMEIETPWVYPDYSRMIPAAWSGGYGVFEPFENFSLTVMRLYSFKGRSNSNYSRTNLYNPGNLGGTSIPALGNTRNPGIFAIAAKSKTTYFDTQLWFYQFYDFAKLYYFENKFTSCEFKGPVKLILGVQGVTESADGANNIQRFTGKAVESNAVGALFGIEFPLLTLSIGYNDIIKRNNAFNGGDIVSPYTSGYSSDPLYTTSMMKGLIEKAAGHAIKFTASSLIYDKHLNLKFSYASYVTPLLANNTIEPFASRTNETDYDVTFFFHRDHHGLSLRERLGVLTGALPTGRFIYSRVMLQYTF
jgi:hypothetical protein